MSDFWQAWKLTAIHEGGYSANINDYGNYYLGQLIGTKYGITPQTYYNFYKVSPTVETMKNLSLNSAGNIAKSIFDKYKLSTIPIQFVANNVFDCLFHYSFKTASDLLQKAVLKVDKNLLPNFGNDKKFGTETLNAIITICKRGLQTQFNNYLVQERVNFYEKRVYADSSQLVFLAGWLNRAGSYVVAQIKAQSKAIILLIGLGALAYYFNKK